jgi:predicted dehydrogenase
LTSSISPTGRVRFGIVGCGAIGPTHAAAIQQLSAQENVELLAVADLIGQRARDMAGKYGVARVYGSDDELIADKDVDVVVFCTPSGQHADGSVKALEAGKHVVVEKPMEVSLEACDRMIAAERKTGRKLAVISQHRWDYASQLVRRAVDDHKLGRLVLADMSVKWWRTQQYYDSGDWRGTWKLDGGGALMNQGVHTVDLLQWLAGGVESVQSHARTAAHERIEVEDVVVAALTFKGGAIGTLTASTSCFDGMPARLDLYGTEGSAVIEGDRLRLFKLKSGETHAEQAPNPHAVSVAMGGTASVKEQAAKRLMEEASKDPGAVWGDAHREQLRDFVRAVRGNGKPLIDGVEGRKPVEIILAVYESARTGKPVKVAG